jgi:hypothetical protein
MMFSKYMVRRDTGANWILADPVLELGEVGFETDTGLIKIGDGINQWSTLSYTAVNMHNNTVHSEVYITADGVTFENLNTNGDVGTAAGTLCAGDDSRLSDARTPVSHNNTYHSETYITSTGVTFENLNTNGDVGNGTSQVAQGDHNHDASYEAIGEVSTHESTYDHTELHTHTNKATLDEIEVAMKKTTFTAPAASTVDYVLAATALADGVTTDVTTGITNPDIPRILSITGNASGITGNVVIDGTNYNDEVISETIVANGTNTVSGTKAFKTVTGITLPAFNATGDTISVGIGDILGLNRIVANTVVFVATADGVKETIDPTITESVNLEENLIEFSTIPDGSTNLVCYFIEE